MARCSEKHNIIEVVEEDRKKFVRFAETLAGKGIKLRVSDLVRGGETTDVRGNSVLGSKALYLVDDDYFNRITGNEPRAEEEQLSLF